MAQVLSKVMPIEVGHKPEDISKDAASFVEVDDPKESPRDDSLMGKLIIYSLKVELFHASTFNLQFINKKK